MNNKLIVSTTTFNHRISIAHKNYLYFLSTQTIKPEKFILWLSTDEFGENYKLPIEYHQLEEQFPFFEIRYIKENILAYKKYLSAKYYPEYYNFFIDDDSYYKDHKMLENVMNTSVENPNKIIQYYSREPFLFDTTLKGIIDPEDAIYFLGQCVLFPPNLIPQEVFNFNINDRDVLKYDEVWFDINFKYHGIKYFGIKTEPGDLHAEIEMIPYGQIVAMWKEAEQKIDGYKKYMYMYLKILLKMDSKYYDVIKNIYPEFVKNEILLNGIK